jgi:hypothetical protein
VCVLFACFAHEDWVVSGMVTDAIRRLGTTLKRQLAGGAAAKVRPIGQAKGGREDRGRLLLVHTSVCCTRSVGGLTLCLTRVL